MGTSCCWSDDRFYLPRTCDFLIVKGLKMQIVKYKRNDMTGNERQISANELVILILVFGSAIALTEGYINNERWYWLLILTLPLLLLAIIDIRQKRQ